MQLFQVCQRALDTHNWPEALTLCPGFSCSCSAPLAFTSSPPCCFPSSSLSPLFSVWHVLYFNSLDRSSPPFPFIQDSSAWLFAEANKPQRPSPTKVLHHDIYDSNFRVYIQLSLNLAAFDRFLSSELWPPFSSMARPYTPPMTTPNPCLRPLLRLLRLRLSPSSKHHQVFPVST